jgi:membrane protein DedA with SNARE-associated domain
LISRVIAALAAFIIAVISTAGYPGVLLLMAIESACIPLPSEIIMPFAGYLVYTGRFNLWAVAAVGALGCNLGSLVAYLVGYYGGRPLVERYGSYILLSQRELDHTEHFFQRWGSATVFVSRMLPAVRTFIALPAGVARMPQLRFHLYTFIGSFPWCLGLAWVGMKLGERWDSDPRLRTWFHRFDAVILAVLVVGAAWFFWSRWQQRIRPTAGSPQSRRDAEEF